DRARIPGGRRAADRAGRGRHPGHDRLLLRRQARPLPGDARGHLPAADRAAARAARPPRVERRPDRAARRSPDQYARGHTVASAAARARGARARVAAARVLRRAARQGTCGPDPADAAPRDGGGKDSRRPRSDAADAVDPRARDGPLPDAARGGPRARIRARRRLPRSPGRARAGAARARPRAGRGARMSRPFAITLAAAAAVAAVACSDDREPSFVGTLERDRIELIAEASEPIVQRAVAEGDSVKAGDLVLRLDDERLAALVAQAEHRRAAAAARIPGAESALTTAQRLPPPMKTLHASGVAAPEALDRARAQRDAARAERDAARAEVSQSEAVLAEARVHAERLEVRAPRDATVDALPYELGERPPTGAV